ncbi:MAG: ankyrin repeat domain-containing protein [Verrucomicrobia bacterium]|nr:MAG: ankyrin repeat domain-containing protein [Verrucomicrobiota bacterium]
MHRAGDEAKLGVASARFLRHLVCMKSRFLAGWILLVAALLAAGCGGAPVGSLHSAAERGDVKMVQRHIKHGTDLNAKNHAGWTALHLAAKNGHVEVVKALLEAGADPSIQGPQGETALTLAQQHGHQAVAQLLAPKAAKPAPGRQLIDGGLGVSEVLDSSF